MAVSGARAAASLAPVKNPAAWAAGENKNKSEPVNHFASEAGQVFVYVILGVFV